MEQAFLPGWPEAKPVAELPTRGNVAASWQWRQMGISPRGSAPNTKVLQEAAEDHLVNKTHLMERSCELPGIPKSTFLMVFSPDGTKVASTHGNHQIYVSELSSGKHVRTLSGHPRTPWCVSFHPSRPQLLGSGCLGGQVRVWDLNGGSEVWTVGSKTVIASIAFHPRDRLLVIATYNELYFWDWSQPQPITKVQTINIKEKVRFVSFDTLGHKLVTGISICNVHPIPSVVQQPCGIPNDLVIPSPPPPPMHRSLSTYYSQLVRRYNNLLRNYRRLIVTQNSTLNTTDRGTDPMEIETNQSNVPRTSANTDNAPDSSESPLFLPRPLSFLSSLTSEAENQSSQQQNNSDGASSLNIDVQSITLESTSNNRQPITRNDFGSSDTVTFVTTSNPRVSSVALGNETSSSDSRPSAFHPLENSDSNRTSDPPQLPFVPRRWSLGINGPAHAPEPSDSDIRTELTESLSRLQWYMEDSIDETLNINESRDLIRVFPVTTASNLPVDHSTRNFSADTFDSLPRDNMDAYHSSNGDNEPQAVTITVNTGNSFGRSPQNPSDMTFEQHLRNIMRGSSSTFMNITTESSEIESVRRILNVYQLRRSRTGAPPIDRPMRNSLMSSDDDSDSDREMFSPLPVHVYRSRNGPSRNFSIGTVVEPLSTPTISRQIDQEYVRNNENNLEVFRLLNIPPPSRPDSPTYPTNMYISNAQRAAAAARARMENERNMPSTSRRASESNSRQRTSSAPTPESSRDQTDKALSRAQSGVMAITKHTDALTELCSTSPTLPLRKLRRMWEDLRREIVAIGHQTPNQEVPSYFRLSCRERCDMLNDIRNISNMNTTSGVPQSQSSSPLPNPVASSSRNVDSPGPSTWSENRQDTHSRSHNRRTYPPSSKVQTRLRYSHNRDPASRVRLRSYVLNRLNRASNCNNSPSSRRLLNRSRLAYNREHEITRVYVRCHARRVLTIMFNIIMDCLDAAQLGELLVTMLRSLKQALGLTCLLLISQSLNRESFNSNDNSDNATSMSPESHFSAEEDTSDSISNETRSRIAIQISAANRNYSSNARKRRETYYLFKRSQALRNKNLPLRTQLYRKQVPASGVSTGGNNGQPVLTPSDFGEASTSGTQGTRRDESVASNESSTTSVSTSTNTDTQPRHSDSRIYTRLFRRFLSSNYGFIRDINAFRRSENQRNTSESSEVHNQSTFPHILYRRSPPHHRIFSMAGRPSDFLHEDGNRNGSLLTSVSNNVVVPLVRVNDVPVSEMQNAAAEPSAPQRSPSFVRLNDPPQMHPSVAAAEVNEGVNIFGSGPSFIMETPESPMHRIQVWDFTRGQLPEIENTNMNVVVHKCRIHNDASIDISRDGRLLVALLPAQRMRTVTQRLGIYSLDWNGLGECLYTALLEQNVVSVSLSPCAKHLAVGLGSRRMSLQPFGRNGFMALIYKLRGLTKSENNSSRGYLMPIRSLEQSWELGFTSLNCLRWAPQPGQGLVYANNTGQLKILS